MKKSRTITAAAAGALALALTACSSGGGASADITAKPDYSGSISILTAAAGDPLGSYFENLVKDYKKLHPGVKITLAQETDDNAIKDKEKVLIGSQSLPDIYFSYAGNWGENFAANGLAADLTFGDRARHRVGRHLRRGIAERLQVRRQVLRHPAVRRRQVHGLQQEDLLRARASTSRSRSTS